MFELDECLRISRKIKDIEEQIIILKSRVMSAKNQVISDMPKGGGKQTNDMDTYLMKLEKYEQIKDAYKKELNEQWEYALKILRQIGVTKDETISLLKFRFYYGYAWKKCYRKMQDKYKEQKWTLNKCFYIYNGILHKAKHKN